MRHAGGRSRIFAWWVAHCALGACSGALHGPESSHSVETCALGEAPLEIADTATIVFRATGTRALWAGRDACALRLVAAALRPWPSTSDEPWTVGIRPTDTSATAYRLSRERARDAIDGGAVIVATEDLGLIAYAAARPELDVTPLPWDRTYLRLAPGALAPLGGEFASEAVRVDARRAEPLSCDTLARGEAPGSASAPSVRVVYEAGDRTARELAERVVALLDDTTATAVGLGPAELDAALRAGDELAYIVSVPGFAERGCNALAALASRAPWISPHAIVPLIDTRVHAIVPRTPRP